MVIEIIYPEHRWVDEDVIRGWYRDLVADGEIEEPDHEVDLWEAVEALSDLGKITATGKSRD